VHRCRPALHVPAAIARAAAHMRCCARHMRCCARMCAVYRGTAGPTRVAPCTVGFTAQRCALSGAHRFIETGDAEWLPRLPMTKAAMQVGWAPPRRAGTHRRQCQRKRYAMLAVVHGYARGGHAPARRLEGDAHAPFAPIAACEMTRGTPRTTWHVALAPRSADPFGERLRCGHGMYSPAATVPPYASPFPLSSLPPSGHCAAHSVARAQIAREVQANADVPDSAWHAARRSLGMACCTWHRSLVRSRPTRHSRSSRRSIRGTHVLTTGLHPV
jgi:hypothetical protein